MVVTVAALGTVASPVSTQLVGAKTGLFASLFSANAYLVKAPHRLLRPCSDVQSVSAHMDARGRRAVLSFLPGAPVGQLVARTPKPLPSRQRSLACRRRGVVDHCRLVPPCAHVFRQPESYHQQFSFYGSPTRAWEFGAGALLALLGLADTHGATCMHRCSARLASLQSASGAFAIHDPGGFPVMSSAAAGVRCLRPARGRHGRWWRC